MKARNEFFCPIINKKVRIENDYFKRKKVSFEPEKTTSVCISANGICNRNCQGCNLI